MTHQQPNKKNNQALSEQIKTAMSELNTALTDLCKHCAIYEQKQKLVRLPHGVFVSQKDTAETLSMLGLKVGSCVHNSSTQQGALERLLGQFKPATDCEVKLKESATSLISRSTRLVNTAHSAIKDGQKTIDSLTSNEQGIGLIENRATDDALGELLNLSKPGVPSIGNSNSTPPPPSRERAFGLN